MGSSEEAGGSVTDIEGWLDGLGLGRYARAFVDNDVDLDVLPHLTESDLAGLGVTLGHRKRILAALATRGRVDGAWLPSAAERRQLTVMFCDLVGSTALAGRLDPEDLRDLIRAYQSACTGAILAYEGFVARYMGDGIMAYFGYPHAHEDDAARAVHAGLAAVEAVRALDAGVDLEVRVGIATGVVVAGDLIGEGASEERAVVGETPNLAARLQSLAAPNEVVVAEGTRRLAGARFEYADLGVHSLKGIAAPVPAWRIARALAAPDRFAIATRDGLAPLVGREEEIGLLLRRWRQAVDGDAQVVVLTGEAGIGKSRVLKVVQDRLAGELRNRVLLYGSPYHQQSAFHAVADQLARAFRLAAGDLPAGKLDKIEAAVRDLGLAVDEVVPVVASLLSLPIVGRYGIGDLGPDALKQRTLRALTAMIGAMAAQSPVLLVVEDAHWIDASTQEFVDLLVDQARRARLLCVVTARSEYEPPWQGELHTTRLTLTRLTRREGAELAQHVAGDRLLPAPLVERIVESTDGVPFFVEELTKAVLESGVLRAREDRYEIVDAGGAVEIPATLQDSMTARLDRLGSTKALAQIASVFGREFSYEWLRAVTSDDEPTLHAGLDRLVGAGLVHRQSVGPPEIYAFKHALVQEAAYASLLGRTRRAYHGRIARALIGDGTGATGIEPEVVARHFAESETPQEAIPYWHRAAERALARWAIREAISHAGRGLELLDRLDDPRERARVELPLRLKAAEAARLDGQLAASATSFARACALATEADDVPALIESVCGHEFAEFFSNVAEERSIDLLEAALDRLEEGDTAHRSRVLASLGRALGSTGQIERATELLAAAIEMARQGSDPRSLYEVLTMEHYLWRGASHIEERLAASDEIVRIADELRDPDRQERAHSWRSFVRLELGDMEGFRADLARYERLATEMRQPVHLWLARSSRAMEALTEGRFVDAERIAREAMGFGRQVQGWDPGGGFGVQMFSIRREQGRLGEVAPVLEHALGRNGGRSWQPGLMLLYAELGRAADARRIFDELAEADFALPLDATWCVSMAYLAEVAAALNDAARAARLYELLSPYAEHTVTMGIGVVCYGAADRYLGQLATTTGDWEAAEAHFARALAVNESMGAHPWLAHTRHCFAELLVRRGVAADRNRAQSLLAAALASADALGMEALRRQVHAFSRLDAPG